MGILLAVDLGMRSGLAVYGDDGVLRSWRSMHFPDRARLKAGVHSLVHELRWGLEVVVAEGDPRIARVWEREADRYGADLELVGADRWRKVLLKPSIRRERHAAKRAADELAREIIDWSGCARPTSLRHDAAEAICIGWWACKARGWLRPEEGPR